MLSRADKVALMLAAAAVLGCARAFSTCEGRSSCASLGREDICNLTKYCEWNSTACTGKEFGCEYVQSEYCEKVPGCSLYEEKTTDALMVIGLVAFVVVVVVIVAAGLAIKISHSRSKHNRNAPMFGEIDESAYETSLEKYQPPESLKYNHDNCSDSYVGVIVHN